MLAELVDHVVGVDPDRDWITLAVLDARSAGVVAEGRSRRRVTATTRPSCSLTATAARLSAPG